MSVIYDDYESTTDPLEELANASMPIPTVFEWLEKIPTAYLVGLIASFVFATLIGIIAILQIRRIHTFVSNEFIQIDLYWAILHPLVIAIVCAIGNLLPRSAALCYGIGYTYLMLAYLAIYTATIRCFGGLQELSDHVQAEHKMIAFNTNPMCCCCGCLPKANPTKENFLRLLKIICIVPIVRIIIQIVVVFLIAEDIDKEATPILVISGIADFLVVFSMFVSHINYRLLYERIKDYGLNVPFQLIDGTLPFYLMGKPILEIIAKSGGISDSELLPATSVAQFWFNVGMGVVMLIASLLGLWCFDPDKNVVFDRRHYNHPNLREPLTYSNHPRTKVIVESRPLLDRPRPKTQRMNTDEL